MNFSLIICTYQRAQPLLNLLNSVKEQSLYPFEILIIDGSADDATKALCLQTHFDHLKYYKVNNQERGLTKQRNFGISKVSQHSEIVCFLDDDTVLDSHYFEEIIKTYQIHPLALGVGGYINNEIEWVKLDSNEVLNLNEFAYDGYKRKEGSRFILRKKLRLDSDQPPGFLPDFSHGRSIGFLPPSNKVYEVEQLMGGVSSFRKKVFETHQFSTFFEGYGLYEDADFTLRVSKAGKLFVNTAATLAHHHDESGRPNLYNYGKMVVRNGYYVWRIKYPNPNFKAKIKWHLITLLLTFIRFSNVFTTSKRKEAFSESFGRLVSWMLLFIKKPKIQL